MKERKVQLPNRPIYVYSDIHADIRSFEPVLDAAPQRNITKICLGDIVGYGEHPSEALNLSRFFFDYILSGNHEAACIDDGVYNSMSIKAREGIDKTKPLLGSYIEVLKGFSDVLRSDDIVFAHANLKNKIDYIANDRDAKKMFDSDDFRIGFVGHTHMPAVFTLEEDGSVKVREAIDNYAVDKMNLDPNKRHIINVPSVSKGRARYDTPGFVSYHNNVLVFHFIKEIKPSIKYDPNNKSDSYEPSLADIIEGNK